MSQRQRGFTLVELLVALVVLSILGLVLAMGMQQVTRWQQRVLEEMAQSSNQLRAQALLSTDLLQLAPRAISDAYGGLLPACQSYPTGGFECSRFEAAQGGAGVVRVGYLVERGALWHLRWPALDRAPGSEPIRQQLLSNVDGMEVRWLDPQGTWLTEWPPVGALKPQNLPRQVELVLRQGQKELLRLWFPAYEPLML